MVREYQGHVKQFAKKVELTEALHGPLPDRRLVEQGGDRRTPQTRGLGVPDTVEIRGFPGFQPSHPSTAGHRNTLPSSATQKSMCSGVRLETGCLS